MVVGHIKITPDPPIKFSADEAHAQQQVVIVIEPSFDRTLILVNAPTPVRNGTATNNTKTGKV